MKRCTVLSHLAFEDLGLLHPLLQQHGFELRWVDVPTHPLPPMDDGLWIVLGGPLGVYDQAMFPFLTAEINTIQQRLAQGAPTIGICLGAQLMAAALGAEVKANPKGKELGWSKLTLTAQGLTSPLRHLDGTEVLHWHGDILDLPKGAINLASTPLTPCQAFQYGPRALGLQFHPEVTALGLERWLVGNLSELNAAKKDIAALRQANWDLAPKLEASMAMLLQEWLAGAGL